MGSESSEPCSKNQEQNTDLPHLCFDPVAPKITFTDSTEDDIARTNSLSQISCSNSNNCISVSKTTYSESESSKEISVLPVIYGKGDCELNDLLISPITCPERTLTPPNLGLLHSCHSVEVLTPNINSIFLKCRLSSPSPAILSPVVSINKAASSENIIINNIFDKPCKDEITRRKSVPNTLSIASREVADGISMDTIKDCETAHPTITNFVCTPKPKLVSICPQLEYFEYCKKKAVDSNCFCSGHEILPLPALSPEPARLASDFSSDYGSSSGGGGGGERGSARSDRGHQSGLGHHSGKRGNFTRSLSNAEVPPDEKAGKLFINYSIIL